MMDVRIEPIDGRFDDDGYYSGENTRLFLDINLNINGDRFYLRQMDIFTNDFFDASKDSPEKAYDVSYSCVRVLLNGKVDLLRNMPSILADIEARLKIRCRSFSFVDENRVDLAPELMECVREGAIVSIEAYPMVYLYDALDIRIKDRISNISAEDLEKYGYKADEYGVEAFALLSD